MKKSLVVLFALVLFLGIAGNATALVITDTVSFNAYSVSGGTLDGYGWGTVNKLNGHGDYVYWTHNYTFNPEVDYINSASFTLRLVDDNDHWLEAGYGYTEATGWDYLGEIDTGSYSLDVNLSSLLDGSYSAGVWDLYGDFYIKDATLVIDYAPVPEPATLVLLGSGLAGLAFYRRKRK